MQLENMILSEHTAHNTGDRVYYTLRENIMSLNFKPGELLSVRDIAEQLGVSRSPVRDAIMKLGEECLVDVMPQKGTSVSQIDLKRMEEERFLRESLEDRALKLFVEQHKDMDIASLEHIVELQKNCLEHKEFDKFLDYDEAFHGVFFSAVDKNVCWSLVQSMSGHYRRVRLMTLWDGNIVKNAIAQHCKMLDAIEKKDMVQLAFLLESHCSKINVEEIELFKKYPEYFKKQDIEKYLEL